MSTGLKRVLVLLCCVGFSCFWASAMRDATTGPLKDVDFDVAVYSFGRCMIEGEDPYDYSGKCVQKEILPMGPDAQYAERFPPPMLLFTSPLVKMRRSEAELLWLYLDAVLLGVAGFLVWDLASEAAVLAGLMVCFMLLNCEVVLVVGDPGGVTVGLCVIGVCCLFKPRWWMLGVLLMGISLVIKPHDPGLVWLYFLLAGGVMRKRALQVLAVVALLLAVGAVWIAPVAPHWAWELLQNIAGAQATGSSVGEVGNYTANTSIRAAIAAFTTDPRVYTPVSYVIGGGLVLVWMVAVLRKRYTREGALLALAAIAPITLIAVYHHTYDAKLLLLTIPGCAVLWTAGGVKRWVALGLTAAAIFVNSDIPIIFLSSHISHLTISTETLGGRLMLLGLMPGSLMLLATGCFYLWVYVRYEPSGDGGRETAAEQWLDAAIAE